MVNEQVRADQVIDGVEHRRVADEAVEPGDEQMGLRPELSGQLAQRPFLRRLERFQPRATVARLGRGQRGNGTEKAVLVVARHLLVG